MSASVPPLVIVIPVFEDIEASSQLFQELAKIRGLIPISLLLTMAPYANRFIRKRSLPLDCREL